MQECELNLGAKERETSSTHAVVDWKTWTKFVGRDVYIKEEVYSQHSLLYIINNCFLILQLQYFYYYDY